MRRGAEGSQQTGGLQTGPKPRWTCQTEGHSCISVGRGAAAKYGIGGIREQVNCTGAVVDAGTLMQSLVVEAAARAYATTELRRACALASQTRCVII